MRSCIIKDIWDRIEAWLGTNAPEMLSSLRPGATRDDIQAAEVTLCVTFPDDMVSSYLVHDGQEDLSYALMGDWDVLSLELMVIQWEIMRNLPPDDDPRDVDDPTNPVRPDWWNLRWVPVSYDDGGDLRCVDLDPTPAGIVGQMIVFWHTHRERDRLALSFRDWLSGYADDLEQGKYAVGEEGELILIESPDD